MDLQQVRKDVDNDVLVAPSTWHKVLDTAIAQANAQEKLVVALQSAKRRLKFADKHINCDDEIAEIDTALAAVGAA